MEYDLSRATGYCPRCADSVGLIFFIGTSRKSDLIYLFKESLLRKQYHFELERHVL